MAVLELRGPSPHERAESGLRRAINAEGGRPFHARDRAVENDGATVIHERQGLLHGEQRPLDVDVEKLIEMFLSDIAERRKFRNAGIGEDDVKVSLCLDSIIKAIKVVQFGNVSLNASNIAADCFHGLVEFLLTTTRDENVGTRFHEELCCSQPYPGCATGNHS